MSRYHIYIHYKQDDKDTLDFPNDVNFSKAEVEDIVRKFKLGKNFLLGGVTIHSDPSHIENKTRDTSENQTDLDYSYIGRFLDLRNRENIIKVKRLNIVVLSKNNRRGIAVSEMVAYSEKPPIPLGITVSFISPVLGSLLVIWGLFSMRGIVIGVGAVVLLIGFIHAIPFFNREIMLTNKEIQVKLWWFKDKIPIEDVLSVETVDKLGKPRVGWGVTPLGFGYRWLFLFNLGVMESRGTRWYVFGDRETYLKINKRNGEAVCIGMENPEEFIDRWKVLQEL